MIRILLPCLLVLLLSVNADIALADNVARAQFTSGISEREPVDQLDHVGDAHDQIYFFTELHNLNGHTVTHRWIHDGVTRAEVTFDVGASRWRVWSTKNMVPTWRGEWSVEVVDQDGSVLGIWRIGYGD